MKVMRMWSASQNISLHGTHPSLSVGNDKMSSWWDEENDLGIVSLREVTSHYVRRGSICFPTSVVTVDRWPWEGQPNLQKVRLDRRGTLYCALRMCWAPWMKWERRHCVCSKCDKCTGRENPRDSRSTICTPIPAWTRGGNLLGGADVLSWVLRYKLGLFWKNGIVSRGRSWAENPDVKGIVVRSGSMTEGKSVERDK